MTRVAAIVVNWRQPDLTSAAVASLEAQTGLDEHALDLTIVIVDNGSGDGSLETLRQRHPQHLVVDAGRNGGFGAGVNAGIRACPADVYVLLNNDAEATPGFVAALVTPLLTDATVSATTARLVLAGRWTAADDTAPATDSSVLVAFDGTRWRRVDDGDEAGVELLNSTGNEVTRSGNGRDRDWLRPVVPDGDERAAGEVFGFGGGGAALRASALEDVGLFDESLFMYYEDTELSWRLRRAGGRIRYAPGAIAHHRHAASSGTGSALFRSMNERNRMLVALRHAPADVAARAVMRTAAGTARAVLAAMRSPGAATGEEARRRLGSFAAALRLAPANLAERRRIERAARRSRHAIASMLVDD